MSEIESKLDAMSKTLGEIHERLFIDKAQPCLQTRLDRSERSLDNIRKLTWTSITVAIGLLAAKVSGK